MSTVAWKSTKDEIWIASDSQETTEGPCSWGYTLHEEDSKILLINGILLAFVGDDESLFKIKRWLGKLKRKCDKLLISEHPFEEEFEFHAVIFDRKGDLHVHQKWFRWGVEDRLAIGSGGQFALGAMDYGAEPKDAIQMVIQNKRDIYTGGLVHSYRVPRASLRKLVIDIPCGDPNLRSFQV